MDVNIYQMSSNEQHAMLLVFVFKYLSCRIPSVIICAKKIVYSSALVFSLFVSRQFSQNSV